MEDMPDVYRTQRARALRIARRILGDAAEAEDVVQEVFVRLWQRPGLFDGRSLWSTFFYRVMVNQSINTLRARRRRRALPDLAESPPNPEEQAVTAQMRAHFARTLKALGGLQAQVVWMREVRGYSYPDIAALLRIPEGTVKSTLHRGRARAFAMLVKLDEEVG